MMEESRSVPLTNDQDAYLRGETFGSYGSGSETVLKKFKILFFLSCRSQYVQKEAKFSSLERGCVKQLL
jgi:hypothetical protein